MYYKLYEKKLNDVIEKCPIEAGVEILVYNLLDSVLDFEKYAVVDINRICRDKEERLVVNNVVPDIAVVSNDFKWKDNTHGKVYGFVEVKAAGIPLRNTDQIKNEKTGTKHLLFTNGIRWIYYCDGDPKEDLTVVVGKRRSAMESVEIDRDKFKKLLDILKTIDWN